MNDTSKMSLTMKVLVGMTLGIVLGLTLNQLELAQEDGFIRVYIIDGAFYVVGAMFVNALKMLVVPLVFFSLLCGVCGLGDIGEISRGRITQCLGLHWTGHGALLHQRRPVYFSRLE